MTGDQSASGVLSTAGTGHAADLAQGAYRQPTGTWNWLRRYRLDIILLAPFVLYLLFFMFVPVAQSIYLSFVQAGTGGLTLANYQSIMNRSDFANAVQNTIGITIMGVSMEMVVGMIVALMLARGFRGRGIFRSIVLLPLGVPTLVAGAAMLYFVGLNGYLNEILLRLGIIEVPIYWQESGLRGMFAIAISDLWKTLPLVVLILLAGLEGIPGDIYEAADVDGAAGWRRFWDITIPLLMPSITMALILRAIDAFRIFDIAIVLAGQSIPVMSSFVYFDYRAGSLHTAAAAAVLLLLMIVVFVLAYFFLVERRTEASR